MFKVFDRQFKGWIAAITLALSTLFLMPLVAQAANEVLLDSSKSIVNVVTVYKIDKSEKNKTLADLLKLNQENLPQVSGFLNTSVLNGQDESEIIALSQWQDLPSFQTYIKQRPPNSSDRNATQTFACQVQHTETRATSPSFSQGDVIQFSQFKMKPNKEQSELAMVVSQMMPGALQMSSGLQWAAMCPSTDKSTIALLARWQSRGDFESLAQQPGFDKSTNYWQTYADNEHGLYDVVKVIR